MAFESSSPFMSLPIPGVGLTDGPQYATDLNNCFTIIDAHTHVAGSGQLITPSAININSDLPFSNNNLTQSRSVRFYAQSAALAGVADIDCMYTAGVDLYYNDGNGNQIRMTESGGVAGTPGSIGNLASPASVTYVAIGTTFVFQSDVNKAANLDIASIILRKTTTSSNGITLSVPSGIASDYTITLPALPGTTQAMTLATSGNIGTITYDAIGVAMTATAANAIGVTMTSTGANAIANTRTRAVSTSVAAGGVAISAACTSYSNATTTFTDITNLTVTITSTGRPIVVTCIPYIVQPTPPTFPVSATIEVSASGSNFVRGIVRLLRDSSTLVDSELGAVTTGQWAPGVLGSLDIPVAGTYVYKLQGKVTTTGSSQLLQFLNVQLVAYEL